MSSGDYSQRPLLSVAMFKLALALVAVASALDTEAPTISMDFSEAVGSAVFPSKYQMECEVNTPCTIPKARGFDTNDKTVSVTRKITLRARSITD